MRIKNEWAYTVQLYHQIKFSQNSIKKLKKAKKSYIEMSYYVQTLLVSIANIAKLLNNNKNQKSKERSQALQQAFKIDISKIPIILDVEFRNTNEHIDERIDLLDKEMVGSDISWGGTFVYTEYMEGNLRDYSPERQTITYADRNKRLHIVKLNDLKAELSYLQKCKGLQYIWDRYKEVDKFYL